MQETVTVLGAGIVGICTALSLAERGVTVQVIDRNTPGRETSYGNAGIISPWSVIPQALPGTWRQIPRLMFGKHRPLSIKLSVWPQMLPWGMQFLRNGTEHKVRETSDAMELLCSPSIELYRRHLQGTKAEHLVADAMYVHAFRDGSRASLSSLDYDIRRQKGADMELIGQDALQQLEPAISRDFKAAILIKGQARATSPGRLCDVLAVKARSLGVTFKEMRVHSVRRGENGWDVHGEGEALSVRKLVLALGVWSADILKKLGYPVPVMAERGYHLEYPDPGIEIVNSVMDVDAKCVGSSMQDGFRFAGQAEFAPIDAPRDERRMLHLNTLAKAAFPGLNDGGPKLWMGHRPSLPDSLPVLQELASEPGLFLNFGHSHYGLMMAPKSGELIADLVMKKSPNSDLAPYSLARFE
ncbi:MAG: FAD-dependent oxidoreductase [Pseudomonadota bacterium]